MPVADECTIEKDAYDAQLDFAIELCELAFEAFDDWIDMIDQVGSECGDALGERPEVPEGADSMLEHAIQAEQEQYDQNLQECLDNSSEIIDAENQFLDLQAACEIELEAAQALLEEYENCLHELHKVFA